MIRIILNNLLLIVLLILAGVFYFLTFTTPGLKLDIALAARFVPGKLTIEKIDGTLFSTFSLQHISYQDTEQNTTIDSLTISWHPKKLLNLKFDIESIALHHTDIIIKKIATHSQKFNWDQLNFLRNVTIHHIDLDKLIIIHPAAKINLTGTITQNWDITWQMEFAQLERVFSGVSGSLLTSGNISGSLLSPVIVANLQGNQLSYADKKIKQLSAKANIIIDPEKNSTLTIFATGLKTATQSLNKLDLTIIGNVTQKNSSLTARLNALINQQYRVLAQLSLPKFSGLMDFSQPITGTVQTTIHQLAFLTKFIPQIKNPQGILQATFNINGVLSHPIIIGNLTLNQGQATIPFIGITLKNINLQATGDFKKPLIFSGNLRSGKGTGQLRGTLDFTQPNYPLSLTLQGDQLQAINLADYSVTISPNLTLTFMQPTLKLQGTIVIPEANIAPKNFDNTVTLPSEVVFVGTQKNQPALPFNTELQITLQLGKKIHIAYHDLETNLTGHIQINQNPGSLTTATGELYTLSGTYKAYGQTLTIQTGRLIFTGGPLMNPGLDIAAVKEIRTIAMGGGNGSFTTNTTLQPIYTGTQNITAGVRVNGSIDAPSFTLFSIPTLSQGDILSYLVLGYPQSQSSGQQQGALLSALSALNPSTSNVGDITQSLQQKLGVTELNVGSTQVFNPATNSVQSTTAFSVGKQLGEKLSIHYSVGLFYPISILNLRYQLAKHWAIQSETSTIDNGADLLYAIERD